MTAGLAEKLSAAANISLPYLYQYRAVGANLSIRDAYILGMYGAGWENIRSIGALTDQDTIQNLIQFFVQSIPDYNNSVAREQAKVALKSALQMLKQGPPSLDTSSPEKLEEAVGFDKEAPEFVEAIKQLNKLMTAFRALTKESKVAPMLKAFGDCYLASNVQEAKERLESFHALAEEALKLLQEVENALPGYKQELESLSKLPLSEVED